MILGTGELYLDCVLHDLRKMYSEIGGYSAITLLDIFMVDNVGSVGFFIVDDVGSC